MILWILNLFLFASAQNLTHEGINIGEAALGGMIPTSLIILLAALIRVLQLYKQRKQQQTDTKEKT